MNLLKKIVGKLRCMPTRICHFMILKKLKKHGKQIRIWGKINIIAPLNCSIGDNCSINHGVYINAFNPISIGNNVTISANVSIISTGLQLNKWVHGVKEHIVDDGIVIGDNVWICSGAQILNGVHITGNNVVIAAGAVVVKSITENNVIYAGVPARKIKKLQL